MYSRLGCTLHKVLQFRQLFHRTSTRNARNTGARAPSAPTPHPKGTCLILAAGSALPRAGQAGILWPCVIVTSARIRLMSLVPAWLESHRIPDADFASAYDATPAPLRAHLKTAIAALHALHGETPATTTHTRLPRAGFALTRHSEAAPWALVVVGPQHVAPPRLLGALLPALFDGVADVLVVQLVDGSNPTMPAPLLVALELAGQEQAFALNGEALATLLHQLHATCPAGRVALLGHDTATQHLHHAAIALGLQTWRELTPPRIGVAQGAQADLDLLRWAHPDAEIVTDVATGQPETAPAVPPATAPTVTPDATPDDVVRTGEGQSVHAIPTWDALIGAAHCPVPSSMASLHLDPALAGCWLHPTLPNDFYLVHRAGVAPLLPHGDAT